ncbi:transmembrane protein [Ceratobasidium theobromae]|uniref:Transmembrane protein n=1 Tax=Ceratobasidium theobromae TaxID=1582974 RepID=A0A5N5QLV3_9AGAM|nr:transmembrane protein [Ceratobasidium theobromae]
MVAVGRYPAQIPPAVVVPHWAYYDFTPTGIFDAAVAQQQLGPESSMVISTSQTYPTDTGTAIVTGTNTALFTPTPTGTKTPNPAPNNTGAIVGGVVGGILGVALIALIGFILVRRNQAKNSTTVQYAQGGFNPTAGSQPNLGSPVMAHQPRPGVPYATTGLEYKPYNPSDPSTYPSDAGTSTYYAESLPYSHSPGPRPGQYTGAPQV